jgi:hypothetical protein
VLAWREWRKYPGNAISIANESNHAALLAAATRALRARGLAHRELRLVAVLSEPERRNLLLRCTEGERSFILKQVRGDYDPNQLEAWDTRRFFRDWVGSEFLTSLGGEAHGARFFAGDRELGFVVLEDLRSAQDPLQTLLHGSRERAEQVLAQFMTRLARMHGATLGARPRYDALMAQRQGKAQAQPLRYFGQDSADNLCSFLRELAPLADDEAESLHAAVQKLEAPGPFQAFIHGDPCLDNAMVHGDELRLIDFELARPGQALLDAVYVLSPFPTCNCAGLLPSSLAFELMELYRRELSRFTPAADDARVFDQALLDACAGWLVFRLGWLLREAWAGGRAWAIGTTRARILTGLSQYLLAARAVGGHAPLFAFAERLRGELARRWPDSTLLPLYPALR